MMQSYEYDIKCKDVVAVIWENHFGDKFLIYYNYGKPFWIDSNGIMIYTQRSWDELLLNSKAKFSEGDSVKITF